jgi:ferrous iron transport protein B
METKTIALVGQPNSGKSTLFNVLSDLKASTSNFAGSSTDVTATTIEFYGTTIKLVDLPGIYSLNSDQKELSDVTNIILNHDIDLVINIIDATMLARNLELTVELLETGIPFVVAVNMIDEAERHGLRIDYEKLSKALNVHVVPTTAIFGKGVKKLIEKCIEVINNNDFHGKPPEYTHHIQHGIIEIENAIKNSQQSFSERKCQLCPRFYAIKAVENRLLVPEEILNSNNDLIEKVRLECENEHKVDCFETISYERHHLSMKLAEAVTSNVRRREEPFTEKLDRYLLHPVGGYFFLGLFFFLYFFAIFIFGDFVAGLVDPLLERLGTTFEPLKESSPFLWSTINGAYLGFVGITGIVLPYFLPLVFLTSLFEETGYMARIAFKVDFLFHKIGLHGKSAVPFMLGFGCSVPALYSARIIENKNDRLITGMLIPFIPCSARIAVIFALSAAFAGPILAVVLYFYVLLVIAVSGKLLSKKMSKPTGLILEIPRLKLPSIKISAQKTWFKINDLIKEAFIFLILGSIVLGWIEHFELAKYINIALSPLVNKLMGLPEALGSTLLFGFLRKELIIVMAAQALGVQSIDLLPLTLQQVTIFIVFVTFYFPCLTTFIVLMKEFGRKTAFLAATFSLIIATFSAMLFKFAFMILNIN